MGLEGTAKGLGEIRAQTFSVAPCAAVCLSSGLVEHTEHSGPPRSSVADLATLALAIASALASVSRNLFSNQHA
eukprot:10613857-Alexandrium_andersonii.AAC.1